MGDITGDRRRAGSRQGIVLLLPGTLAVMASVALAPGLPALFKAFGAVAGARWLVPMIITLPALCLIVFAPVAGWLGDRYGRRPLLIGGLIVYAALGLAPLLLDSLAAILVSRVGVGVAEAFALTLSTAMIGDHFDGAERDKWLGSQVAIASVAAIGYIAICGALGRFGWRGPFLIYLAPLVFVVLVIAFTWENRRTPSGPDTAVAVPFPWKSMALIWPVSLFTAIMFYAAQIESSVALHAIGVEDPASLGLLLAVSTLATVAGSFTFRAVLGWPTARLLAIGFACLGVGYSVMGRAHAAVPMTVGLSIAQYGCGIVLPTTLTWAIRRLPLAVRGRGIGMWQGVFSAGQFLSPISVTAIAGAAGGVVTAFGILGVLDVAAALLALALLLTAARSSKAVAISDPA